MIRTLFAPLFSVAAIDTGRFYFIDCSKCKRNIAYTTNNNSEHFVLSNKTERSRESQLDCCQTRFDIVPFPIVFFPIRQCCFRFIFEISFVFNENSERRKKNDEKSVRIMLEENKFAKNISTSAVENMFFFCSTQNLNSVPSHCSKLNEWFKDNRKNNSNRISNERTLFFMCI